MLLVGQVRPRLHVSVVVFTDGEQDSRKMINWKVNGGSVRVRTEPLVFWFFCFIPNFSCSLSADTVTSRRNS